MDCHWNFYAALKEHKEDGGRFALGASVLSYYRKSVFKEHSGKAEALLEKSGGGNADSDSKGLFVSVRTHDVILCRCLQYFYVEQKMGDCGFGGSGIDFAVQTVLLCTLSD